MARAVAPTAPLTVPSAAQLERVDCELASVARKIEGVEVELDRVAEQLLPLEQKPLQSRTPDERVEILRLAKKEGQLRKKEEQLRKKEEQLRDKELKLMDEREAKRGKVDLKRVDG